MAVDKKNTSITPAKWKEAGSTYPLSDLPVGDYTWTGSYTNGEGTAYSCLGFARMVLDATYGKGTDITASADFTDETAVKTALKNVNVGDRVTFATRSTTYGNQHAVIVTAKGTAGITVYDCNRAKTPGKGYIAKTDLSWKYMKDTYSNIKGGAHHK